MMTKRGPAHDSPIHDTPEFLQVVLQDCTSQSHTHFAFQIFHSLSDLSFEILKLVNFIHNDSGPLKTMVI